MTDEPSRKTWLGNPVSRRSLLAATPFAAVGGLGLGACTRTDERVAVIEGDVRATERPGLPPTEIPQALRFFTAEEARAVEAATARIVPGSADDPGAVQAGVVVYIDAKLAEFPDFPEPTYHEAPFANQDGGLEVDEDQLYRYGFQSPLTPRDVYHLGVPALDRYSQTRFGELFHLLDEERQDEVLSVLEAVQDRNEQAGEVNGNGDGDDDEDDGDNDDDNGVTDDQMDAAEDAFGDLNPGLFFTTLRDDTIEGMFSDPAYGGNAGMVGWALIGYPGAQRSYSPHEMLHGADRQPQAMHQLTAMSPDRAGGHPALEQEHQHQPHSGN